MKTLIIATASVVAFAGATISTAVAKPNRHGLDRISDNTGIPVTTLENQRVATGFGYGELEKAHLLANASGRSFNEIVAMRQSGQGWGQIAHSLGLNLGQVVSNAHRSDRAAFHANNGGKGPKSGKERGRSGKGKKFDEFNAGPGNGHGQGHGRGRGH